MNIKVQIFVKNEENPLYLEYLKEKSGQIFEGFRMLENIGLPVPSLGMKEEFKKEFGHFVNFTLGPLPETFSFKDFDVIFRHLEENLQEKFKISNLLFKYDIQLDNEHSELQEESRD
jgi:hypothetical protein